MKFLLAGFGREVDTKLGVFLICILWCYDQSSPIGTVLSGSVTWDVALSASHGWLSRSLWISLPIGHCDVVRTDDGVGTRHGLDVQGVHVLRCRGLHVYYLLSCCLLSCQDFSSLCRYWVHWSLAWGGLVRVLRILRSAIDTLNGIITIKLMNLLTDSRLLSNVTVLLHEFAATNPNGLIIVFDTTGYSTTGSLTYSSS